MNSIGAGEVTDYIDGIQYRNGSIDFIQTEEGIARRSGTSYIYEYNLGDHLGNVRYSFKKNASSFAVEPLQADNYYAFGLRKPLVAGSTDNKIFTMARSYRRSWGSMIMGRGFMIR